MKFNKWTLGLAAVGAVSLTSVAQAEEKLVLGSQATMTSTVISGYVDTSAHWNIGRDNGAAPGNTYSFGANKADGFNLNVVQLSLSKALDESEWASGYRTDIWFGPDAVTLGTQASGDVAIRQAYIALRTPIGNGIDWKMGVFDTVVGYETLESGNNPNYTRSLGFTMEPTTHTGLLGTYRFCDSVSASGGIANTFGPLTTGRSNGNSGGESHKTLLGSVALTAPSDWGWVAGSSLYVGAITGFDNGVTASAPDASSNRDHYYAGVTLATPVAGLKVGASVDYTHVSQDGTVSAGENGYAYALYASFQATEKLSIHGRAELLRGQVPAGNNADQSALTATFQYDLWKNVISRAELRWDHNESQAYPSNGSNNKNAYLAALNLIYKF